MPSPDLRKGPPTVPLDLLEWLEAVYPDRFPAQVLGADPHALSAGLHRHAGAMDVVRRLREAYDRQAKAAPPNEVNVS